MSKITVTTKALRNALDLLTRIIPNRSSVPSLMHVHVALDDGGLTLTGSNLEIDLRLNVPADVPFGEKQAFTVLAHQFSGIVSKLPSDLTVLTCEGSALHITSGNSKNKLATGDLSAYTLPDLTPAGAALNIDAREWASVVRDFAPLVPSNAFQAAFNGLYFELTPERPRIVTSSGYWIAYQDLTPVDGLDDSTKLLVPSRALNVLGLVLSETERATVHAANHLMSVTTDRASLRIRLMEAEFMGYERVIPKVIATSAVMSTAALQETLSRVGMFYADPLTNKTELSIAENQLSVYAQNDYGESTEALEVTQAGEYPALASKVNGDHLGKLLKAMPGELTLGLSGKETPFTLACTGQPRRHIIGVALRDVH